MSTTAPPPASPPDRPGRLPRWVLALIALLSLIALVAVVVAVIAIRGPEPATGGQVAPTPVIPASAAGTPTASPSATGAPEATIADGCLGGPSELDRAVITAQKQTPLNEVGAATFTASLMRWVFTGPPPPFQKRTATQILTPDASSAARRSLSSSKDLEGSSGTLDFRDGKYYVESFDGNRAIVSYLGTGHLADNGTPQPDVLLAGSVHLQAVNGVWRYRSLSSERSIEDLQRIGVPYSGGC